MRPHPTCIDLLCNLLHSQFAICHVLPVELDAQEPRRDSCHIEVGHLVIDVHPLLVLGHHRVLWVGIVVDGGVGRHLREKESSLYIRTEQFSEKWHFLWLPLDPIKIKVHTMTSSYFSQCCVLQPTEDIFGPLCVTCRLTQKENSQWRRLWPLRNVDQLLQTGHTECYVLGRHAGVVESVQGHLSGWLSQRLSSQSTHHLTGVSLEKEVQENKMWCSAVQKPKNA